MATYVKFNDFVEQLALGNHDLHNDTLKAMLTNSAPSATDTVSTDITEISNGNGYTTGGEDITNTMSETPAGTATVAAVDVVWTASGSVGPFQYVVIYNSTDDGLVCYWDYGSAVTLSSGETFTVDFGSDQLLTIT